MAPRTTDREYGPGAGPPPAALSDDEVLALVASRTMGVLASVKRDGSPHLANMIHAWDPEPGVARISTVDDRVKVTHYRRDPTAVLHVTTGDFRSWGAAQGTVAVSPVATCRTDELADRRRCTAPSPTPSRRPRSAPRWSRTTAGSSASPPPTSTVPVWADGSRRPLAVSRRASWDGRAGRARP